MVEYGNRGYGARNVYRKRRYRDDEDDEDDYDRRPLRRRYEEPLAAQIRKMLISIAETATRRTESDVSRIASMISENTEDGDIKGVFTEVILQLVIEQPFKIPFVAAVVLLVNEEKPDLTAELLTKTGESAQTYIAAGLWREVKLIFRFLGCLQGLFDGAGIFPLLDELFSRAMDQQTASSEDSLGLELVKTILFTIPYVMASSASGCESQANALLEKTDIIASTPHTLETLVDPFPSDEGKEDGSISIISLLQKQLQKESKHNWKLQCIPRPWKVSNPIENNGEDSDCESSLAKTKRHIFPTIFIPNPVPNGPRTIFPEVFFSVYIEQDIETVPPIADSASLLIRDALVDTINVLDFNRTIAAKQLIDVDCFFAPGTFVKRATPFDRLRDIEDNQTTWKPEDVAVDAVFSQLLQLPLPEHKFVYYHSVLTETCKIAPAAVAPSLGRAIRFLYRNIQRLDLSLSYRVLDWFAHHLSNFGFTWKWAEWINDLSLPVVHPKKTFIIGAVDKEIRLSFAQRIRGTLPEEYQPLISESKDKDTPDFKYSFETTPYAKEGMEIMQLIRKKAPDSEIAPVIASIQKQAIEHGVSDPLISSTDAFVTAVCFIGSKSLSHVLSCIERTKERLLSIGPQSAAARRQIISSVIDYWHDQPSIGVNIVDKLLNYTILTPLSVIEWALVDKLDGGYALTKPHIYEMVSATVGKVTNRIRQIVAARAQPTLVEPQLTVIDETLTREKKEMEMLFALIEDALVSVATATNDVMMECANDDKLAPEYELVKEWGKRWLRVFRRKYTVEQTFIAEAMVNAVPVGVTMPAVSITGLNPVKIENEDNKMDAKAEEVE